MKPRRFPDATGVFALPGGNEDNDLWVQRAYIDDAGRTPAIRSVWELTDAERAEVAAGGNISLVVIGHAHPPVQMYVTSERLGRRVPDGSDGDPERGAPVPPGDNPGVS